MATINVRRDVTDPFYRYKMDRLQTKIEGKGNGIKTVVVNLNNVAQNLKRNPAYIIKYFGFEIGAQANAKVTDDRWIINGAHDSNKLQDYLDGFIQKFVLCKKCKNPETTFVVKDNDINLDCKACGERSIVDPRLRLTSFIVKNEAAGGKDKKDKSSKRNRRDRTAEKTGDANAPSAASKPDGDDEIRQIEKEVDDVGALKKIDTDNWELDLSPEAVAQRAKDLPGEMQRPKVSGDSKGTEMSSYEQLGKWFDEEVTKSKNGVSDVSDVEIYKKLTELGIEEKPKTLFVLAQAVFDTKITAQIPLRSGLLIKLLETDQHRERFLNGTIKFLTAPANVKANLHRQLPSILLAYYQHEIIPEEYFLKWWPRATAGDSKASKRDKSPFDVLDEDLKQQLIKDGTAFIDWLKNAEEESESDEE